MAREGYCKVSDLLISGTRLPQALDPEGAIASAADEIDAQLGYIYKTPFDVEENDSAKRQDTLYLKTINKTLASGRIIMAMATAKQDDSTNAYARYLLNLAQTMINKVINGVVELTSAEKIIDVEDDSIRKGPLLIQGQRASGVDAFYETFQPDGFVPGVEPSLANGEWPRQGFQRPRW